MIMNRRQSYGALGGFGDFGIAPAVPAAVAAAPAVVSAGQQAWNAVASLFGGGGTLPPPGELPGKMKLSNQHGTFTLGSPRVVYYMGPSGASEAKTLPAGTYPCNDKQQKGPAGTFDSDPQKGANKACYIDAQKEVTVSPAGVVTETSSGLFGGGRPGSGGLGTGAMIGIGVGALALVFLLTKRRG